MIRGRNWQIAGFPLRHLGTLKNVPQAGGFDGCLALRHLKAGVKMRNLQ